jgi:PTH2 family peptidyl-tRNA hydrolase
LDFSLEALRSAVTSHVNGELKSGMSAQGTIYKTLQDFEEIIDYSKDYEATVFQVLDELFGELKKMNDELVQYFVVNSELGMSAGKIAAQVAHVEAKIVHNLTLKTLHTPRPHEVKLFEDWFFHDQAKIILRGKQKDLEKLIEQGWFYIRDNGRTEITADSLTVVGCAPEYKSTLKPIIKRFQLL